MNSDNWVKINKSFGNSTKREIRQYFFWFYWRAENDLNSYENNFLRKFETSEKIKSLMQYSLNNNDSYK